jgi:hypothetical protein
MMLCALRLVSCISAMNQKKIKEFFNERNEVLKKKASNTLKKNPRCLNLDVFSEVHQKTFNVRCPVCTVSYSSEYSTSNV